MPGNFKKEDLRVIKTRQAILKALDSLLGSRNFSQITVNDICTQALVSRTAFYAHFKDKYDLLEYWLGALGEKLKISMNDAGEAEKENMVFACFQEYQVVLRRLVSEYDRETFPLLLSFFAKCLVVSDTFNPVIARFCAGGLFHIFAAQSMANQSEAEIRAVIRCVLQSVRSLKNTGEE